MHGEIEITIDITAHLSPLIAAHAHSVGRYTFSPTHQFQQPETGLAITFVHFFPERPGRDLHAIGDTRAAVLRSAL